MAGKKNPQVKVYMVIVLAMVLAISAYFRLIRAKVSHDEASASSGAPPPPVQLQLPRNMTETPQHSKILETLVNDYLPPPGRDIFTPPAPRPKKLAPPPENRVSKPQPPPLNLKGTIVGGKRPIAIIDNRFVRPGDWVGDYKVTRIGKKEVVLESGNHKLLLEIMKNE